MQAMVDAMEKILDDCLNDRTPDAASLRAAFRDFDDAYARFEPVGKQTHAFNLKRELLKMHVHGFPEDHVLVQEFKRQLVEISGESALVHLEAAKSQFSLSGLVPRAVRP